MLRDLWARVIRKNKETVHNSQEANLPEKSQLISEKQQLTTKNFTDHTSNNNNQSTRGKTEMTDRWTL